MRLSAPRGVPSPQAWRRRRLECFQESHQWLSAWEDTESICSLQAVSRTRTLKQLQEATTVPGCASRSSNVGCIDITRTFKVGQAYSQYVGGGGASTPCRYRENGSLCTGITVVARTSCRFRRERRGLRMFQALAWALTARSAVRFVVRMWQCSGRASDPEGPARCRPERSTRLEVHYRLGFGTGRARPLTP